MADAQRNAAIWYAQDGFDPAAKGSQAFVEFAQEMVDRVQRMPAPAKSEEKSASSV